MKITKKEAIERYPTVLHNCMKGELAWYAVILDRFCSPQPRQSGQSMDGSRHSRVSAVRATIDHLLLCRKALASGYPVSYTTDPSWLVNMAINRRAGWFDDPSQLRGSAMPVPVRQATRNGPIVIRNGKYPPKASGDYWRHLVLVAYEINRARVIVREQRLGELRSYLLARIPHRITRTTEDMY